MFELKIGRHTYNISKQDTFVDNGNCVQLTSQSKEKRFAYRMDRPNPKLSKKAIKLINCYKHLPVKNNIGSFVKVFTLDLD